MKIETFQLAASIFSEMTEVKECLKKLNTTEPFAGIAFYFGEGDAKEFVFPPQGLGRHYVAEVKGMLQERVNALEAEFAALQDKEEEPESFFATHYLPDQLPPSSLEIAAQSAEEGGEV